MSNPTLAWQPPPRPDWLAQFNAEGRHTDLRSLVPLQADELIATACRTTGFSDFGDDHWREPFDVLLKALEEEAELHYFGRLMTRNDLLIWLQSLLGVQAAFTAHPEIAEEKIDRPVIIAGLSRSGTSILFELLSQDPRFGSPRHWEMMFPYPPPERETYDSDPRIERCQHLITQWNRVAPTYATMHEMDARLPNECIIAQACTFVSEYIPFLFQVPSYMAWLGGKADWSYPYQFYKKLLQLWQWRNPRERWLLKAPSHLNYLPTLFQTFPDAQVLLTHRDPLLAQASVTNLAGTFYWMRSDKPMDAAAFEGLLSPAHMAARLERVIDWMEGGAIPREQCANSRYADLIEDPLTALAKVYQQIGLPLTAEAEARMVRYLENKPKGKFGTHQYDIGEDASIRRKREYFQRYQRYFDVPNERVA